MHFSEVQRQSLSLLTPGLRNADPLLHQKEHRSGGIKECLLVPWVTEATCCPIGPLQRYGRPPGQELIRQGWQVWPHSATLQARWAPWQPQGPQAQVEWRPAPQIPDILCCRYSDTHSELEHSPEWAHFHLLKKAHRNASVVRIILE